MTVSVTVDKRSEKVVIDASNQVKLHRKAMKPALNTIGLLVGRETNRLITTGVRTGRIYNVAGRQHRASAFGEAPASLSGRLAKSYEYKVSSWHTMRVGESAPYAEYLERGTKFIKPRQHLITAINNKSGDAVRIFYASAKREIAKR